MSQQFSNLEAAPEVARDGGSVSASARLFEEAYGAVGSSSGNDANSNDNMRDSNLPQDDGGEGNDNGYLKPSEPEDNEQLNPSQTEGMDNNDPIDNDQPDDLEEGKDDHDYPGPPSDLDGDCDIDTEDDIEVEIEEGEIELARGNGTQDNGMPKRFLNVPALEGYA